MTLNDVHEFCRANKLAYTTRFSGSKAWAVEVKTEDFSLSSSNGYKGLLDFTEFFSVSVSRGSLSIKGEDAE